MKCPDCGNVALVVKQWGEFSAWVFCEVCKFDGAIDHFDLRDGEKEE